MRTLPPTRRLLPAAVATIVIAALAPIPAGCGSPPPPPAGDGLLVAADGRLLASDASGALMSFDGPADPVVAVTASGGRVVAATTGGALTTSPGPAGQARTWTNLARPAELAAGVPLMALSPLGTELALAVGEPQAERFDLVILEVDAGTSRTIAVERGLNGPPAWIGPATIAVNVIGGAGNSEIATVDVRSGGITDEAVVATVVSATADGLRVAFDDPSGNVLVGDIASWRSGSLESMTRIRARAGSAIESLAMSPGGGRLAVIRRDESGLPSLEVLAASEPGWTSVGSQSLIADGPISIAWLQ